MKKLLIYFCVFMTLIAVSCSRPARTDFLLTGKIEGLEAGKKVALIAMDFDYNKRYLDTAYTTISTVGGFELKGVAPDSLMAYRIVFEGEKNQRYPIIFLENEHITISGNLNNLRDVIIKGSKMNKQFYAEFKPFIDADRKYEDALNKMEQVKSEDSVSYKKMTKEVEETVKEMRDVIYNAPMQHPSSIFSPFIILITSRKQDETFHPIVRTFTQEVKESYYGKKLIEIMPTDFIGMEIPKMIIDDRNGKPISLNENLGKYNIVDFWASWCPPCRKSIPELKRIYEEYNPKGLNIYGISVDKDSVEWIKALDEEQMPWFNVRDKYGEHSMGAYFEVKYIPHVLLVDSKGIITHVNPTKEEIKEILDKNLSAN